MPKIHTTHFEENQSSLRSWGSCIAAVLCSLAMIVSMISPGIVYATSSDPGEAVLDFEGSNPVAFLNTEQDQPADVSALFQTIRAVRALRQNPEDFVMQTPDVLPEGYQALQEGIYQVPVLCGRYPYRVYGSLDGWTGWFAFDQNTQQVCGFVEEIPLHWDADALDVSQPGVQLLQASVLNAQTNGILPAAQITITPADPKPQTPADSSQTPEDEEKPADDSKAEATQSDPGPAEDPKQSSDSKPEEGPAGSGEGSETENPDSPHTDAACNNHTLVWKSGSDSSSIDGNVLTNATTINGYRTGQLTAHLVFSYTGSTAAAPGSIRIVLPLHVLKNRDGNWTGGISLPFPKEGEEASPTGFAYTLDEAANEAVITNTKAFSTGNFLEADITYQFAPYMVANGTRSSEIQAVFSIVNPESGELLLQETSDPIHAVIQTDGAAPTEITKDVFNTRQIWNMDWGDQPADAKDYVYTEWLITSLYDYATQPFSICIQESPQSSGTGDRLVQAGPGTLQKHFHRRQYREFCRLSGPRHHSQ